MSATITVSHFQHLVELRNGGKVTRYHTAQVNRRENNAEHSHGVALICLAFWPDTSCRLLKAAILHDLHETLVGDMPHTIKRDHPTLGHAYAQAEYEAVAEMGIMPVIAALTDDEHHRLKVADVADAFMYGREEYLSGNMITGRTIMGNSIRAFDKYPEHVPEWFKSYAIELHRTL